MTKAVRLILILLLAAFVLGLDAEARAADVSQQAAYLWKGSWRGPGWYLSWPKIATIWVLFVIWLTAADWVNRDSEEYNLKWQMWNPIVVGGFFATMLLCWLSPWFWLNVFLLLGGAVSPVATYVFFRNRQLPVHQHVFTPAHLRYWFADKLQNIGVRVSAEAADPNAGGGVPVKVYARGGADKTVDGAHLLTARQTKGLPVARKILFEALKTRASAVVLDYAATNVAIRYLVDGVWMPQEPMERETADPALDALKSLCGLEPKERRAKQSGKFGVEYSVLRKDVFVKLDKAEKEFREATTMDLTRRMASEELQPPQLQIEVAKAVEELARKKFATPVGAWTPIDNEKLPKLPGVELHPVTSLEPVKTPATLTCQGTQAGERVVVEFEIKGVHLNTLDELGMRAKMQEQLKEVINRKKGFVLLSAVPSGGLRTTTKVLFLSLDRFVREFATLEDEANRYDELENVPVSTYNSAAKESPVDVLARVLRTQPQVLLVRDLVNAKTVKALSDDVAKEDRMIVGTVRAKDSVEALLRVYAIEKAPIPEFRDQATAILSQRLVRKLCDKCKEPYSPGADVLKQLGLPAGKVKAFYRPPTQKLDEDQKDLCRECGGVGYLGQTAIYELLIVDDLMRKTLATTPKLDVLRAAARKSGMKSLQEEGIFMVVRGATSLPELMRVLKGEKA